MIGLLHAPPGSRLYKRLKKEGRLLEITSGDNCDGSMNFIPKMGYDFIRKEYHHLLNNIYSPRQYYLRVLEFLNTYVPARRHPVTVLGIVAFLNIILHLGILDNWRNSVYFWKLMIKTLIFHRRSMREAVTLMMFGYHFRKLLKK